LIVMMMVEDNGADVRIFREAMKDCPFCDELIVHEDGETAVDYILNREEPRPHLILLDLNLPKKNGWEVLEELKGHDDHKDIPILVLTSSSAPRDIRRAYDLGCNAYLVKKDDYDEIKELVQVVEGFWVKRNQYPVR
jgi:CheY-like chemotaxis protein